MLFPESERVLYEKNPLAEVVCQFRFPTILRIREGQLADFQDRIRKDYPVYTEQEPSIELPPQAPKELAAIVEQMRASIHLGLITRRFSTKEGYRFISLSDGFLAVAEKKYEKWEVFRDEIEKAERSLKEVYEPAFYGRIGLRYRDMISRRDLGLADEGWENLFNPQFIAELGDKNIAHAISETRTRTMIKINEMPGGQITLTHGLIKPPESDDECYIIDADFSVERKEGVNEPFEILDKFSRMAGRLFRWAITPKLHNAMGPRALRVREKQL